MARTIRALPRRAWASVQADPAADRNDSRFAPLVGFVERVLVVHPIRSIGLVGALRSAHGSSDLDGRHNAANKPVIAATSFHVSGADLRLDRREPGLDRTEPVVV